MTVYRGKVFYNYIKKKKRDWKGNTHIADSSLGYRPNPNTSGEMIFPIGPNIPFKFDENGFRVPLDFQQLATKKTPVIMTFGDSFTFGDACYIKDTFPFLIGKELGGTILNAGVAGYGVDQMLLRARKFIPKYKSDIVIVQHSPWLLDRSLNPFAHVYWGMIPTPYFVESKKNSVEILAPQFATKNFEVPIASFRDTPSGISDFYLFMVNVSIPLSLHKDLTMLSYYIKRLVGYIPNPIRNRYKALEFAYKNIQKLSRENGSKMVVLLISEGNLEFDPGELNVINNFSGVVIVDAEKVLRNEAPDHDTYKKLFGHWRGSPTTLVDTHPNAKAHNIISLEILKSIK